MLTGTTYQVDIEKKTCTCLLPNQTGLPCVHVMAAAKKKGMLLADIGAFYKTFCDDCYLSDSFKRAANGIHAYMPGCRGLEDIVAAEGDPVIHAPQDKVRRGKKADKRKRSRGELTQKEIAAANTDAAASHAAAAAAAPPPPPPPVVSPPVSRSGLRRLC